jgi:hypothetical protein
MSWVSVYKVLVILLGQEGMGKFDRVLDDCYWLSFSPRSFIVIERVKLISMLNTQDPY